MTTASMSLNPESEVMFQADGEPTVTWTRVRTLQISKKRRFLCPGVIIAFAFLVAFLVLGLVFLLNDQTANRRDTVRQMTREAWQAYVKHAWGNSALQESSTNEGNYASGLTIVESLSTLWLMDLKEEFSQGRNWVKRTFLSPVDLTKGHHLPHFDVHLMVQRYLGSLLSSYALTDDSLFLEMTKKLAGYLEIAFKDEKELPLRFLKYSQANNVPDLQIDKQVGYQSEFAAGGETLELRYLSQLIEANQTQSTSFWGQALKRIKYKVSLFVVFLHNLHINHSELFKVYSLQKEDASFVYSYLVKSFLQSNGSGAEASDLGTFLESLKDALKAPLFAYSSTGLLFIRDQRTDLSFAETMEFPGCNWGAILGLASVAVKRAATFDDKYTSQAGRLLQMGKDIVKTCQLAASMRAEGLTPKEMNFPIEEDGHLTVKNDSDILLSPELAESLFVLWRVTGDEAYRETAWQMVTAIRDRTRDTEEGGFRNVEPTRRQDPSLIGGTFKYLYLIFSDDETLLPLDKWVFNAVGQPLPICRHNDAYAGC